MSFFDKCSCIHTAPPPLGSVNTTAVLNFSNYLLYLDYLHANSFCPAEH